MTYTRKYQIARVSRRLGIAALPKTAAMNPDNNLHARRSNRHRVVASRPPDIKVETILADLRHIAQGERLGPTSKWLDACWTSGGGIVLLVGRDLGLAWWREAVLARGVEAKGNTEEGLDAVALNALPCGIGSIVLGVHKLLWGRWRFVALCCYRTSCY